MSGLRSRKLVGSSRRTPGNAHLKALPLLVGNPALTCDQGSSDGNFGSLDLPPTPIPVGINGNQEALAYNIMKGLSNGLAAYPPMHITVDKLCDGATPPPGTKLWNAEGTNCVKTAGGVDPAPAQWGFLTGIPSPTSIGPGLLADTSSDRFCPLLRPQERRIPPFTEGSQLTMMH